ncbi:MAG: response regulator, partial [Treponema sp.]|nr:response regulator [Treponema sp.]
LFGDELRIKQILNNLLSNAFKYTERGEVMLSVHAERAVKGGSTHVTLVFNVGDTGQGMTQEQVRKLFDEYSRFNLEANRTTEGAGLGMSITQNLVNLMYGKISMKSTVGEGTLITVYLPQKDDDTGVHAMIGKELAENLQNFRFEDVSQAKKTQIIYEPMPYGRILIVDDVDSNLYVAKGLMAPYGMKIDTAASGFEAIDKIKAGNNYDIVFMDHMMPKMDGIETTKLIRGMGYTRPVVALTANALTGQAEVFLKSGFDGFISKPIDIRQLNISLNKLIRDKQPPEVIETARRVRAEQEKKRGADKEQRQPGPQLAEIFARDAEKAAAVLEEVAKNDYRGVSGTQMYIINIHAMKSALANIGESELSAAALRLEQAGRDGDNDIISAETPAFLEALRAVIEKNRPKDDTGDNEDADAAYLREKLLVIQEACAEYDKKTAKDILNEIRERTWSRRTKGLLTAISEHLLHSEFDEAAKIAGDYISTIEPVEKPV